MVEYCASNRRQVAFTRNRYIEKSLLFRSVEGVLSTKGSDGARARPELKRAGRLAPAFGIIFGLAISAVVWAVVLLVWYFWRHSDVRASF